MMEQATAFQDECTALASCVRGLGDGQWSTATQFKGWTLNDVFIHLHFWNEMADLALVDVDRFHDRLNTAMGGIHSGSLRSIENTAIEQRGSALFQLWEDFALDMAHRWRDLDPKRRVPWAGPDMSVRSSITARQMETWAHGHEVFDVLGKKRVETDRIRNVVVLGINTFGWSFQVQKLDMPKQMPRVELTAPSGEIWVYGEDPDNVISGSAVGFAQVVTQTRNVADTDLQMAGPVAELWMQTAQCFAGPKEPPPAPGSRHVIG